MARKQIPLALKTEQRGIGQGFTVQNIAGKGGNVNVFVEATDGEYPFKLRHTEGTVVFCTLPDIGQPVKALYTMRDGRCFCVTSRKMYELFADGTSIDRGNVVLDGEHVSAASNGQHLVVVDGLKGFYFDNETNTTTEITAEGFYPARTVDFQDGYFVFEHKNTQQFFISGLYSVTFDPLDFASSEGHPDFTQAVFSDHRELFIFGDRSIGVFYNSGAADFPFEQSQSSFIEKGTLSPYSICATNSTLYFVGHDRIVYSLAGYTPVPISSQAVAYDLSKADLTRIKGLAWQIEGHLFYMITMPDLEKSWCYDISTQQWHIREHFDFGRHLASCVTEFENKTLVGDFQAGLVYQLTTAALKDNGRPQIRRFTLPRLSRNRDFFTCASLEIDMTTGVGHSLVENPVAWCRSSKDGVTFGNTRQASIGRQGEFLTRVRWNRFGRARKFDFEIIIEDPVVIDVGGAYLEFS